MKAKVIEQLRGRPASDGAGVKLLRVFGGAGPERFDPFLMLDEFGSDDASDYIAGFPAHPHRGFSTVTYMLQGKMEHRDHLGNVGLINDGDVQWMTAGRGVIHSEMPQQTEGKMRGFQFWINLPASKKMQAAAYQDIAASDIPQFDIAGSSLKAIAGSVEVNGEILQGFLDVPDTQAIIKDIHLPSGKQINVVLPPGFNKLAYTYDGEARFGEAAVKAAAGVLTRFDAGKQISISNAADCDTRVLLMAGLPLKEPIVQRGPFVMNSWEGIEQAIIDYQEGTLV